VPLYRAQHCLQLALYGITAALPTQEL
jgi:hypothetical protein